MIKLSVLLVVLAAMGCQGAAADACSEKKKVVCYYASWSVYREGAGAYDVSKINPKLCTHLIYTFSGLDVMANRIASLDTWNDLGANNGKDSYNHFMQLKQNNSCVKTMLAIGGWNEKSRKYSVMASTADSRKAFANSVLRYLVQYEFDGIDIDWEYPGNRGGINVDKNNFLELLKELRAQLKPWDLLLSAAVGVTEDVITNAYNIKAISEQVDFINLMAYDFTSTTSKTTGLIAPLDSVNTNDATIAKGISNWVQGGCPPEKLVLGIPTYARSFKLKEASSTGIGAPTIENTMAGRFTKEIGFLSNYELLETFKKFKYDVHKTDKAENNYATNGTFWITYDTEETVSNKVKYALDKKLGGIMVWSIDTDDFQPLFSKETYPIVRAINKALGNSV